MKSTVVNPFLINSLTLQQLLDKAAKQKNPALWLFQNNVRTPLFMLEALTRIHDKAFDEKLFNKWHKRFKKLEDAFGELDNYTWLQKEFTATKKAPIVLLNAYKLKSEKLTSKLNTRFTEKHWFNGKLNTFVNAIDEFTVTYNKEYISELKIAINEEVEGIIIFLEKIDFTFTKLEEEVHELRRKLRWLSIYAQALNGLIQLKKSKAKPKYQQNYFSKDILASPYNKLPKKPANAAILEYDSNSFFALSWIINELGKLKDDGSKFEALRNYMLKTESITENQANEKAANILKLKPSTEADILKHTTDIVKTFVIKDSILKTLVVK